MQISVPRISFEKRLDVAAWGESRSEGKLQQPTDIPRQKKHIPKVACLFGRRGDGKTLMMSTLARIERARNDALKTSFAILANYELEYADRSGQSLVHELQQFPDWLEKWDYKLILIDEIADILPSARGMSNNNLLTISFLRMLRKLGCSVVVGTQFPQEISLGLLRQVDYFIRCKSRAEGRYIDTFWWDWPGNITGKWGRKYWPPEPETHDWSFRYHNTDKVWGSYRTEEIIAPHHIDESRMQMIRDREAKAGKKVVSGEKPVPVEIEEGIGVSSVADHPQSSATTPLQEAIMSASGSSAGKVHISDILNILRDFWGDPSKTIRGATAALVGNGIHVDAEGFVYP